MARTVLAATAASTLALATAAAAQAPPAVPATPKIEKFVASIKLTDIDRWDHPRQKRADSGCQGSSWYEGHGRQVEQLQTEPMRIRVLSAGAGSPIFSYGPFTKPAEGLTGRGRIKSAFDEREWTEPGPCTQGPVAEPRVSGKTCSDDDVRVSVSLVVKRGRIHPVVRWDARDLIKGGRLECNHYGTDGGSSVYERSAVPLRAAELFDRDKEFVVFSGRATVRSNHKPPLAGSRARELKWTLRLRRAR